MLDKCGKLTRSIYRKRFESVHLPNDFPLAYARRDERDERESRAGGLFHIGLRPIKHN